MWWTEMRITRTPIKATGGITLDEKSRMEEITKKWIKIAFRTDPINKEKITDAIYRLYESAGLKCPRVVIVPSPFIGKLASGIAAAVWYIRKNGATHDSTYAATRAATRAATDDATDAATSAATDAATYAATSAATRAATYAATDAATDAATNAATLNSTTDATRAATSAATDADVKKNWLNYLIKFFTPNEVDFTIKCISSSWKLYQGGNMWAYFMPYAEAMRDVIGLTGLDCWKKYQSWEDSSREGGFRFMHKKFCIVSDFPEKLTIDEKNRPHNEHGPSHRWRDGFEIYSIHGVLFPKNLYLKIISREMGMADILKIADIDQRVQAMKFAKNGVRDFYKSENGKMIDMFYKKDKNEREIRYELWEIPSGKTFNKAVHFMVYECPSAKLHGEQREYAKGVPPFRTVAECMAWGMSDDVHTLTQEEWKKLVPLEHES